MAVSNTFSQRIRRIASRENVYGGELEMVSPSSVGSTPRHEPEEVPLWSVGTEGQREHYTRMYQRFYQKQLRNDLGREEDRQHFAVMLKPSLEPKWIPHIILAVHSINEAAPGLDLILYYTKTCSTKYRTIVIEGTTEYACYTMGDVRKHNTSTIRLSNAGCDFQQIGFNMKSTSVHELLHALGFEHEHKRRDAEHYILYTGTKETDEEWYDQYVPEDDVYGLTVFDPFSIMMYDEDEYLRRNEYNPIWHLKPDKERSTEMSELDKVGLNLLYPPCCSPDHYDPLISQVTKMWYCGRPVMQNHNRPAESRTDGRCGPTGVNCPACRTLKNAYYNNLFLRKGCWQGWSGLVYCGKYFGVHELGHDGYCGPNNGPHCPECAQILLPKDQDIYHVELSHDRYCQPDIPPHSPEIALSYSPPHSPEFVRFLLAEDQDTCCNITRFRSRNMTFSTRDMMTTSIFHMAGTDHLADIHVSLHGCTVGYESRHIRITQCHNISMMQFQSRHVMSTKFLS